MLRRGYPRRGGVSDREQMPQMWVRNLSPASRLLRLRQQREHGDDAVGGAKVLSLITGCEPQEESLEIGEEVELVIEKIREDRQGNEVRGYKFRPVGGEKKER